MRPLLLALAILYAWLPSGLCACRLQAALLPAAQVGDSVPVDPCDDDDDDDPTECHCTGAKPLCIVADTPCLHDDGATIAAVIALAAPSVLEVANPPEEIVPPFLHCLASPLYLTLRALLI